MKCKPCDFNSPNTTRPPTWNPSCKHNVFVFWFVLLCLRNCFSRAETSSLRLRLKHSAVFRPTREYDSAASAGSQDNPLIFYFYTILFFSRGTYFDRGTYDFRSDSRFSIPAKKYSGYFKKRQRPMSDAPMAIAHRITFRGNHGSSRRSFSCSNIIQFTSLQPQPLSLLRSTFL